MNRITGPALALTLVSLTCLVSSPAYALILTGQGNQPVPDPGWPEGALAVANLESRVGWWEGPPLGGGEWHFLYRGDTGAFQEAIAAFAAIRAPALELVIHDGPHQDSILKSRVDWAFTVWIPASWYRLYNDPRTLYMADQEHFRQPVAPPRLDVYAGGDGGVNWAKIKVPAGVRIRDERAAAAGTISAGGALVRVDIYDMATGKPVEGARITLARYAQGEKGSQAGFEKVAEAVSDRVGHTEIAKLPAGTYRVTVTAEQCAPRQVAYERPNDRAPGQLTVELAPLAKIEGSVTDTGGKPLKGVQVRATTVLALNGRGYKGPEEPVVETDGAGHFELAGLPAGYAQLSASARGFSFRDHFEIYEVPAKEVVLRLDSAGTIHVTVTDKEGHAISQYEGREILVEGEPKGGSKVGLWGGSAKVKDDGTYEFNNVQPGEYRVTSRPNPSSSNRQYTPEQIITVAPGTRTNVKVVYE